MTFRKIVKERKKWKFWSQLKAIIAKKHLLITLVIESIGIILVIISFFIPWYYHIYNGFGWIRLFHEYYFIEAVHLYEIFSILLYYPYLIGLGLLFGKISLKKKISNLNLLELIEAIFIFPGIMLIFSVRFGRIPSFIIFDVYNIHDTLSGPSSGFILYIVGFSVLMLNGLHYSVFSRYFRS